MANNDVKKDVLDRLANAQSVAQMLFQTEAERMAGKHGSASKRTLRIHQKARGANQLLKGIEVANQSHIQPVKAERNETVIYGRVTAEDLRGISRMTVSVETPDGAKVMTTDATTDATGKYTLRVPKSVADKYKDVPLTIIARARDGEVVMRENRNITLEPNTIHRVDSVVSTLQPTKMVRHPQKERRDPASEENTFTARGTVRGADGSPVGKVMILLYDKDVTYDDLLGAQVTSEDGEYDVRYRYQDFSEDETNADLYVVIRDLQGNELYSSIENVIYDADQHTTLDITLPK